MRATILACFLGLICSSAVAERFMGRQVDFVDRRVDQTSPAPLIIALDGFLGSARNMRRKTNFDTIAVQDGFVVVYVNGVDRRWNDGRDPNNGTDDVAYLSALIQLAIADGRTDPNRVYLAGHSNGGGMAMRMACDRPDLIAGIAVAATKVPTRFQCGNGQPVPAIFFHGTVDPVAPPEGRPDDHRLGGTLSQDQTITLWSDRNGCRGVNSQQVFDARDDGTIAYVRPYTGCRARLVHVVIEGHGHGWPGSGPDMHRLQGPASLEIDAAALSLWFFNIQ